MATKVLKSFGKRLRALRIARAQTQEKLADSAGINAKYLGDVERGTRNVSLENIARLARALRLTLSELLEGVDA